MLLVNTGEAPYGDGDGAMNSRAFSAHRGHLVVHARCISRDAGNTRSDKLGPPIRVISATVTRYMDGRKFGISLLLSGQKPSRLPASL
jgi:hypothetical protein